MFETLLFDLDGTLTNPFEGITNAILYALGEMGIHETDRQKLTAFIGPPLLQSFREFYGLDEDDALRATRAFRVYYERQGIYENVPYEGISQALAALKTQNGLNSLGVLYGFGSREELLTAGADLLCETPARLPEVIS